MEKEPVSQCKKIVTVGGGSGGYVLLTGLVHYSVFLTAVCTVFDSGGSTGVLRVNYGILPPGDLRRCLLALAPDESGTLRELLGYRFTTNAKDSLLEDHSFGNIMMSAAEKIWGREEAIERVSRLLNIRGEVVPVSYADANLCAKLSDASLLTSEASIDTRDAFDERSITRVFLKPEATISDKARAALEGADLIVMGPGDHYTSLIPNVLVHGFAEALRNSDAKLVYVANLMTKGGETKGFTLDTFVRDILSYTIGREVFDVVIVNNVLPPRELLKKYKEEDNAEPVVLTDSCRTALRDTVRQFVETDLLDDVGIDNNLIRHDPHKLARAIMSL